MKPKAHRRGTTVVEFAIAAPLAFLFLIGLIVAALGVFRYQHIADLAREAAMVAATHGPAYAKRTGKPMPTGESLKTNVVLPQAAGLSADALDCQCDYDLDAALVRVTLRYQWIPEAFLTPVTLSSTAVMALKQ